MLTPEQPPASSRTDGLGPLCNDALTLCAESFGLPTAVALRSELRAAGAPLGRVVVVGEPDQHALETIAGLLDYPQLIPILRHLSGVHTTFRFDGTPALRLVTDRVERLVPLILDGRPSDPCPVNVPEDERLLQVDVALPAAVLSLVTMIHLPDLHRPGVPVDLAPSLTADSVLAYVKNAAAPLSAIEEAFVTEAGRHVRRQVLLVTEPSRYPAWREVARADREILGVVENNPDRQVLVMHDGARRSDARNSLMSWLGTRPAATGQVRDVLDLVRASAARALKQEEAPLARLTAYDAVVACEGHLAQVTHVVSTWLPRLVFELSRLRAELNEQATETLAQLEQRLDQEIQLDSAAAVEHFPQRLLDELRHVQETLDEELLGRLDVLLQAFLGENRDAVMPGGIQASIAPEVSVRLVEVTQPPVDGRAELFASLGNFSSGRQSLSLISSVVSVVAVPVALVGSVVGIGMWRVGKRSREDARIRAQASRWLRVQVGAGGRVLRYRIDQAMNEAQLSLNLAVRERQDWLAAKARADVEESRRRFAAAEAADQERAERCDQRKSLALNLIERCAEMDRLLSLPKFTTIDVRGT